MIDYRGFHQALSTTPVQPWADELYSLARKSLADSRHGKMDEWVSWLAQLPTVTTPDQQFSYDTVCIGERDILNSEARNKLERILRLFHPWRKGPFSIFGIDIDTEWRSDWKWARIKDHLQPLHDRYVLDVGCGNGYHLLRMLGEDARLAVGIDPTMLYVMQFHALKYFMPNINAHVLPLRLEDLPSPMQCFDTVFSMGVLYHCRSPIDHLSQLKQTLRSGGELVLETLIIDGGPDSVLVPNGRYAKMRNVWFIPSVEALIVWLKRVGFSAINVVDVTATTLDEQRSTDWMQFESLADFIDRNDNTRTVEGFPAPIRATVCATAP